MTLPSLEDLKKLRKKLGITQDELAKKAGVSQPLIARIESMDVDPRYSTFKMIYETLKEAKKEKMSAKEVMHSPVTSISANKKIKDAIDIMRKGDFSQLPVVENKIPIGSVSENTIVEEIETSGPERVTEKEVRTVMEDSFPTVSPTTDLNAIISMLEYAPAVLVTKKGRLKGVITKQDIMKIVGEK